MALPRGLRQAGWVSTARIRELCDYIREHASEELTLRRLAKRAQLSPFHLQRSFKAMTGVSPRQFQEACRLETLKDNLRSGPVTHAVYESGFGSASRVYERAPRLGMTPAQYGAGGRGAVISYAAARSPLGRMMLAATDRGLCFVQFADTDAALLEMLRREFPHAELRPMLAAQRGQFRAWIDALQAHLRDGSAKVDLPLDIRATAFQMRVWDYLRRIPSGQTRSYTEVAEAIGQPSAARAVARACATNRVAVLIPCHRVLRGTGELSGYRWGVERKRQLLNIEKS